MIRSHCTRAPFIRFLAGGLLLAGLSACAGGVQHSYPEEHATADRFDPRPNPDEATPGLFTGEGLRWVRDLAPGRQGEGAARPAESEPNQPAEPGIGGAPSVDQDPGPEQI